MYITTGFGIKTNLVPNKYASIVCRWKHEAKIQTARRSSNAHQHWTGKGFYSRQSG